jgi:hypothetical protein
MQHAQGLIKGGAVLIFLLFMIVVFIPQITCAVVQASADEKYIEVTTAPCGIPGFINQTKKLTPQQFTHLNQYLINLNARLNRTTSETEISMVFDEAIEELNTYGLLPNGMSVPRAKHLISGNYLSADRMPQFGRPFKRTTSENSTNYFCLIAGYSDSTQFWSTFMLIWFLLSSKFDIFSALFPFPTQILLLFIYYFITMGVWALDYLRPLMLWGEIILYGTTSLCTLGLKGMEKWSGNLYADINGFTGFKLKLGLREPFKYFFIGSTVTVEVTPADP